jgi:hypothetical protein
VQQPGGVAGSGLWDLKQGAPDPWPELQSCCLVEAFWNVAPQRVRVPYTKGTQPRSVFPSNAGTVKVGVNLRGPPRKAKYVQATDSEQVP